MTRRDRLARGLPMALALAMVAAVWVAGAVWSFSEQQAFAAAAGFLVPALLPLTLDGLALSLASVAWAASLDGRSAVQARLGTGVAVAASAASNARWADERTGGDASAVLLAAGVPVASFLAFEVLLAELRRQVHRRRGLPAPVAVPGPRLVRLALAPATAWREWRTAVLALTAPPAAAASAAAQVMPMHHVSKLDNVTLAPAPAPATAPAPASARKTRDRSSASSPHELALGPRRTGRRAPAGQPVAVPDELLEVGRQVAAELAAAGKAVSHRNLIAEFRARGQSLGSDRASALLRALRA